MKIDFLKCVNFNHKSIKMKAFYFLFFLSLVVSSTITAQLQGFNLLYVDDEPFLIIDSQVEDASCFYYTETRSVYSIKEGELYFDSILSMDMDGGFSCANSGEGNRLDYSGNLVLTKVLDNEKQILKLLSKGGVNVNEYASELSLLSFEAGVLKEDFCFGEENVYCSSSFGFLQINTWGDYWEMSIYQNGKLIRSLNDDCAYCFDRFIVVPSGIYTIKVVTGENRTVLTMEDVEVKKGQKTYADIEGYVDQKELNGSGTAFTTSSIGVFDFLYSNSNLIDLSKNDAPQSFHLGGKGGVEIESDRLGISKLFGTYGFDFCYTSLQNEYDSIGVKEVKRTNYSAVYYTMDVFFRQYFTMPITERYTRPFLDIGAGYRLPLYFRKNVALEGVRFSEKWLHKYNELVLFARLGVSNGLALNATYRPFNSIKNELPQLPALQFGLSIMIDSNW